MCDVGNRENVTAVFEKLAAAGQSPDILVNSAGINVANRMMSNLDPTDFDQVMNINVTGTFNCMHAALPAMREKKSGLIINVISVAGRRSMVLAGLPYCVSKHAQSALGTFVRAGGCSEWHQGDEYLSRRNQHSDRRQTTDATAG